MFLIFDVLLLEAVLVLVEDRLVPDENDEPRDIIELGRCADLIISGVAPENELRNFGAIKKIKKMNKCIPNEMENTLTFFQL